jgi:hypothetical protein
MRDVSGLQQKIDRQGIADRFCAPERELRLRKMGKHDSDTRSGTRDVMEEVGRARDPFEQFAIGDVLRRFVFLARQDDGEGRIVGKPLSAIREDVVHTSPWAPRLEGLLRLETLDIGQSPKRKVEQHRASPLCGCDGRACYGVGDPNRASDFLVCLTT